ncbi:alpha/beta hydrolase [Pseudogemmobacter humi]|uniref:Alpha/beta hydrolase family protein n=1 Tax=Pseudogemmobacter humi TaxID=2483812 RepID=A0A3P5XVD1_9RHOB|nr:alpha/beta hydrolase [Pseudogemmobacter humi]VDC32058.1 Alpha/beta hydrolase family protein [Pseudogemmobacter humi]
MTRPPYSWPSPDRDYANGDFIPGAADFPPRWRAEAAAFRTGLGARAQPDLDYGPGARQRYDLFLPEGTAQGTVIFIHGGYWLAFGREDFSHLARGPLLRGWAVAMPSYTLTPAARIHEITAEMARLTRLIAATRPGPVTVTGHSAGGHLAARMGCADLALPVARVVPISPLAELGPLMACKMNKDLRLDTAEAATESPARLTLSPGTSAHIQVGANERPAFLWQARTLSEEWACPWTAAPGCHHFDVIDALTDPASALTETLLAV